MAAKDLPLDWYGRRMDLDEQGGERILFLRHGEFEDSFRTKNKKSELACNGWTVV